MNSPEFPADGGAVDVGDGIRCIVSEYVTIPSEEAFWEAHKKYVDIHYLLSGEELIRVMHTTQGKLGAYQEDQDNMEVYGDAFTDIKMKKGIALCLFPNDAHQVRLQICDGKETLVKKVVFKVPVELF